MTPEQQNAAHIQALRGLAKLFQELASTNQRLLEAATDNYDIIQIRQAIRRNLNSKQEMERQAAEWATF